MPNQVKNMKITPLKCILSERQTKRGGKIYNIQFTPEGSEFPLSAVTFSDTIAKAVEDNTNKLVDAVVEVGEYNGAPSYTINELAGVKNSGFKKGAGFVKDVVSLERRQAATVAAQLIQYSDTKELKDSKSALKLFKKLADEVYVWISTRPSEPEATGGATEQKEDAPELTDEDIPPEFK